MNSQLEVRTEEREVRHRFADTLSTKVIVLLASLAAIGNWFDGFYPCLKRSKKSRTSLFASDNKRPQYSKTS